MPPTMSVVTTTQGENSTVLIKSCSNRPGSDFSEMLVDPRHNRPPGARWQELRRIDHMARAAFRVKKLNCARRLLRTLSGIDVIGSLESENVCPDGSLAIRGPRLPNAFPVPAPLPAPPPRCGYQIRLRPEHSSVVPPSLATPRTKPMAPPCECVEPFPSCLASTRARCQRWFACNIPIDDARGVSFPECRCPIECAPPSEWGDEKLIWQKQGEDNPKQPLLTDGTTRT